VRWKSRLVRNAPAGFFHGHQKNKRIGFEPPGGWEQIQKYWGAGA